MDRISKLQKVCDQYNAGQSLWFFCWMSLMCFHETPNLAAVKCFGHSWWINCCQRSMSMLSRWWCRSHCCTRSCVIFKYFWRPRKIWELAENVTIWCNCPGSCNDDIADATCPRVVLHVGYCSKNEVHVQVVGGCMLHCLMKYFML